MRVVHIARGFGDYLFGLVNAMAELIETHIVISRSDEWFQDHLTDKVHIFNSHSPRVSSLYNIISLASVVCYIRDVRPTVIHLQSGLIWELCLMKLFPNIPFVFTVHDINKHPTRGKMRFLPQSIINYAVNKSDAIIVHGNILKTLAGQYYKETPIYSIPHGVISRYGQTSGKIESSSEGRVLFFGSVDEWKGVEYLVASEPFLKERLPQIKIIIAGGCADPVYYQSLVKPGQNIELRLERQNEQQVKDLFEWADVIAIPYIESSQSGVLQLAFSFALPAVCTNVGGLPDVVIDGKTGILIDPRDSKQLARSIINLILDNNLRKKVIENIIIQRESKFNWQTIAIQTLETYSMTINMKN